MNKKPGFNPIMSRRDFLTGTAAAQTAAVCGTLKVGASLIRMCSVKTLVIWRMPTPKLQNVLV